MGRWKPIQSMTFCRFPNKKKEQWTACVETDFMHPDGFLYQDALMESLVSPRLHTAAAMLDVFEDTCHQLGWAVFTCKLYLDVRRPKTLGGTGKIG